MFRMEHIYLVDGPEVRHAEGSGLRFSPLFPKIKKISSSSVSSPGGAVRAPAPAAEPPLRRVLGLRSLSVQTRRYKRAQVSFNSMNKSAPGQCQCFKTL